MLLPELPLPQKPILRERAAATRPQQLSYIRNLVLFQGSWCFYGKWIFGSKVVGCFRFYLTGLGVVFLNGISLISNAGVTIGAAGGGGGGCSDSVRCWKCLANVGKGKLPC